MRDGLYQVHLVTPDRPFVFVAHCATRRVLGGDADVHVVGTYDIDGERLTLHLTTDRHDRTSDLPFAFDADRIVIALEGPWHSGGASLTGTAREHDTDITEVSATLRFLVE